MDSAKGIEMFLESVQNLKIVVCGPICLENMSKDHCNEKIVSYDVSIKFRKLRFRYATIFVNVSVNANEMSMKCKCQIPKTKDHECCVFP